MSVIHNLVHKEDNRHKDGTIYPQFKGDKKLISVLISTLYFEFGYGAQLTNVERNKIELETNVMGSIDKVVITGGKEEMQLLSSAILLFHQLFEKNRIDALMEHTKGNPLLLKTGGGLFANLGQKGSITKVNSIICSLYLGDRLTEESLSEMLQFLGGIKAEELEEAIYMYEQEILN